MLSFETKVQLCNVIIEIAKQERELEFIRRLLSQEIDFVPYIGFIKNANGNKGYNERTDLLKFAL